jgi:Ser/Thr protein kinase RdoA (MazF antagonist)
LPNHGTAGQLLQWLRRTAAHTGHDRAARQLADGVARAIRRLGELDEQARRPLPWLAVQGDFTLANLGFHSGGRLAYLDFDVAGVGRCLHDVAYVALIMLRSLRAPVDPQGLAWDTVWRMVDEYEGTGPFPLTAAERRALPLEMARVSLCLAARAGFAPTGGRRSPVYHAWADARRLLATARPDALAP